MVSGNGCLCLLPPPGRVTDRFGASVLFPFQRPYLPFQQWALRTGACHLSPLGILIHQEYGLRHALRGALLFPQEIEPAVKARLPSPCDPVLAVLA